MTAGVWVARSDVGCHAPQVAAAGSRSQHAWRDGFAFAAGAR